ncbi:MAG TPA: hypothetical protein VEB86_09100 [Chryseosolibacter sp.]|nr:hypothetical protein [Chryseosolibacter sp.]
MKILHQLGHNAKWNIDAFTENDIGSGFIYSAFNFTLNKINNIDPEISTVDLQYYGKKSGTAELGKFSTFPFHPQNGHQADKTTTSNMVNIYEGIKYQESLSLKKIIIPAYYETNAVNKIISVVNTSNKYLRENRKKRSTEYYMTIVLSLDMLVNANAMDVLLSALTDKDIIFDGYYVVCESDPGYKKKINPDYDYVENLCRVFLTLKGQGFKVIHGYSNWDAIVFLSICDIDYVTIGTYENLRNFNPDRFMHEMSGGPSDGWYFSEKLLNLIKTKEITNIRRLGGLPLIPDDKNIFSDVILDPGFIWNTHKPDIHKNYLLALSRILNQIVQFDEKKDRINFCLSLIEVAKKSYEGLAKRKIYLEDESSDYFLSTWSSFLRSKQ